MPKIIVSLVLDKIYGNIPSLFQIAKLAFGNVKGKDAFSAPPLWWSARGSGPLQLE
jgi:hypothetical protein